MKEAPFTVIERICSAAAAGNKQEFLKEVAEDAVVDLGGELLSGASFANDLPALCCEHLSIEQLEITEGPQSELCASFFTRGEFIRENKIEMGDCYCVELQWKDEDESSRITSVRIRKAE